MERLVVDKLWEKHEFEGYEEDAKKVVIQVGADSYTVLLPDWLPDVEVLLAMEKDSVLVLVGRTRGRPAWALQEGAGAVLLARQLEDGSYAVNVWHEFWPWTLAALGLVERGPA
jgi:hypothetical protein